MTRTSNAVLTKEQKLIKENEIMGKILLEIILKYKEKSYPSEIKTDEQIAELLDSEDWKERSGFSVKENGKIGWREVHWYAMKPQEIVKELNEKKKILKKVTAKFAEEVVDGKVKVNDLEKELKEKEVIIEHWKQRAERGEEDAEIHFKALTETSKEWNERKLEWWVGVFYKKLLDLNKVRNWQIENNLETIKVKDDDLEKASERIKVLENFVAWQEYVADKQFQELPVLPKKENKFKILANKVKNRVNETKVAVKEKFNAYILQKSK